MSTAILARCAFVWGASLSIFALFCRKRHALRIGVAPEPSDIIWENLEITSAQRLQRQVFILLINLIIISVGMFLQVAWVTDQQLFFYSIMPHALFACATQGSLTMAFVMTVPNGQILQQPMWTMATFGHL